MYKKRKKYTAILTVFISVFVTGAIYASVSGNITLNGYANLSGAVAIRIVNAVSPDGIYPYKNGAITVSEDGQTINIAANLTAPGEFLDYKFSVQNTGSVSTVIGNIITEFIQEDPIIISGDYINLANTVIPVGEVYGEYYIRVEWDGSVPSADGNYSFSITVPYEKAQ